MNYSRFHPSHLQITNWSCLLFPDWKRTLRVHFLYWRVIYDWRDISVKNQKYEIKNAVGNAVRNNPPIT